MQRPCLSAAYQRHLAAHGFDADPAQQALVARLQQLLDDLVRCGDRPGRARLPGKLPQKLLRAWSKGRRAPAVRGVYVWGDVGRGKTFLLNLFFRNLPSVRKTRVHFHQFMREVHALLAGIKRTQAPLRQVAQRLAERSRLLYLDEFHVVDIGDAMILAELLRHLTERGVVLAMTSNCAPAQLYDGGLQRQRFLPAIALIEEHLDVLELGARCDYRLQFMCKTDLYLTPADAAAERLLEDNFRRLITDSDAADVRLRVNGHDVLARRCAGGVVWFDFEVICGGPRAAADYLELAHCYETVLVSGIPAFEGHDDLARRFINMIDTFYDCHVRFIASAAAAPADLYRSGRLAREFRRTESRLNEMQSPGYITQTHA